MMKQLSNRLTQTMSGFFCAILLATCQIHADSPKKWIVYYNDQASFEEFAGYETVVFDSEYHPDLAPFQDQTLLGYISLGEAEKERSYFPEVKAEGILLQENVNWPGSFYVDMRDGQWEKRVVEQLVPQILAEGFQGIFMDTLDNPEELDAKYPGMRAAAVKLVKAIRTRFPNIKIMMNRGYQLLPEVAPYIDMELGESVYTTYNFETKKHSLSPEYAIQVELLNRGKAKNPNLEIYTLDYWDPTDKAGIKKIYQIQRKNGFIPYVSTVDLHKIIPEN